MNRRHSMHPRRHPHRRGPDSTEQCFVEKKQVAHQRIEYDNVELYLCGIQSTLVTCLTAASSVLACWLLPSSYVTSVRTLAVCTAVAFSGTVHAFKIQGARGAGLIFNALRPCPWIYLFSLVVEQLGHTCLSDGSREDGFIQLFVFNALGLSLALCGIWRAVYSYSHDVGFFTVVLTLMVLMAVLPTPVFINVGPLCAPASFSVAFERCARAVFFACAYSAFVYSRPPQETSFGAICSCCLHASCGSVWVLVCSPWVFILAPVQFVTAVWVRLRSSRSLCGSNGSDEYDSFCAVQSASDSDVNAAEAGNVPVCSDDARLPTHSMDVQARRTSTFTIPAKQLAPGSVSHRRGGPSEASLVIDDKTIAEALSSIPLGAFAHSCPPQ